MDQLLNILPYLLFLICPISMFFMHGKDRRSSHCQGHTGQERPLDDGKGTL